MRPSFRRMAGHGHQTMHMDPALVKYANMSVKRHEYFRWTPRTAWVTLMYVGIVPAAFLYLAFSTEGKYEMRGKRRGDTIVEF